MSKQDLPLWEVMQNAQDAVIAKHHPFATDKQVRAAEIRAVRDWIIKQLATDPEESWGLPNLIELPNLEDMLTTEANKAEQEEIKS